MLIISADRYNAIYIYKELQQIKLCTQTKYFQAVFPNYFQVTLYYQYSIFNEIDIVVNKGQC